MSRRTYLTVAVGAGAALAGVAAAVSRAHRRDRERSDREWESERPGPLTDLGSTPWLRILPLADWSTASDRLRGEAGVSYLVETEATTILFDTGFNRRGEEPSPLEHNMAELGVDLDDVDTVVISHLHPDHVGGIARARRRTFSLGRRQVDLSGKRVITPVPMTYPGVHPVHAPGPTVLAPGVATTGTIPRRLFMGWVEEQALAVDVAGHGLVLIVGCGHQTLPRLLERAERVFPAPVYGVVGGLHYPVPHGRGRFAGVDVQRRLASGDGPLHPITMAQVRDELGQLAARSPGLVALSPHDSSDEAIEAARGLLGDAFRDLCVGQAITVGTPPA